MKKIFGNLFSQRRLALKIWLCMVMPVLIILLLINISIQLYYNSVSRRAAVNNASEETAAAASVFSDAYTELLKRFVLRTASASFADSFQLMYNCDPQEYTNVLNELQSVFSDYADMSSLVSSALFVAHPFDEGEELLFYSYTSRPNRSAEFGSAGLFPDTGLLSILPVTDSPFLNEGAVIPVAAPLYYKFENGSDYILLCDDFYDAQIIIYLFLDARDVSEYLKLYCNDESEGSLLLVDSSGAPVSELPGDGSFSWQEDESFWSTVSSSVESGASYLIWKKQHVFIGQAGKTGLYLLNIIPEEQFADNYRNMTTILPLFALFGVLLITVISLLIILWVTLPLKKLTASVTDIEAGVYHGKADISSSDEIGQLNESIDSMYNTIQEQIQVIQQQEQEKFNARMQLLTEQMNPHFLYNALEFINMEVINSHTESASSMISALGNYLHISLACGESELELYQELDQVTAYVDIMNYRFRGRISLRTDIPDRLLHLRVIKCILQPLAENSLKHGFRIGSDHDFPISPQIQISAGLDEQYLTLSITDNGAGFDEEKVRKIMVEGRDEDDRGHLGLHNIYERLESAYGNVGTEFSSIPFFENRITFHIAADRFPQRDEVS